MKRKPINWFKVRVFFLSWLIFFCFALVIGRMFQLQVLKKEQLYELANHQQHAQIPLVPKRGIISDRKGNELAVSIEVDSVCADSKKIVDPGKTAQSLASILQTDPGELKGRLKKGSSFEWIQRKITPKEVEEIKTLRLPGIFFLKENKRFYPNGQLGAHVIGFVGLDSKGLEGLESQYDNQLNGNKQVWYATKDARGREIVENVSSQEGDRFQNIVLTLDKHVQHIVETELGRAVQKWGAKAGFAIAMEPFTGKILAMVVFPSFNPNQFLQCQAKAWRNRAIADTFEPGSMFKTFLAAAALEEKIVRLTDSFYCENGSYTVYERTIHDHSKHGWLNFQQIIKFSSNIGASKVGEKLGKDRFYRYIKAFGFGEKTQIGLPGESKGILHHPRYWSPITLDTISFGQGISVTGIQMITALSAIANGGFLMKPLIIEKITDEKGQTVQSFKPEVVRKVMSEETAKKLVAVLKTATERGGTGEGAVPAGFEVAGKTGTAQKVDSLLRGYSEDRFTSGFMGFAPVEDPKLAVIVVIDEPQGNNFGGVVAAPVFKGIVEKVLPYLNVFPKGTQVVKNESEFIPKKEAPGNEPFVEDVKMGKGMGRVMMPDLTGLS
ncbi:MAG TPA: penicillin-binding protein 2, partial [Thermodesulfobacteriota bacterium]|nr:penicillin-binding protein 2 [Thermodesulfobacteriota bacterium]